MKIILIISLLYNCSAMAQDENSVPSDLIEKLLRTQPQYFSQILADPAKYRVQIVYTQIERDQQNMPHLTTFTYRPQAEFYYPASLVKLPIAALALEKIHQLAIPELTRDSRMVIQANHACQTASSFSNITTDIKKALIMSDNEAYNRLYEFLGQKYINERLWAMSYHDAHILRRFNPLCNTEQNRHTSPITFYADNKQIIYRQPAAFNSEDYTKLLNLKAKKAQVGKITYGNSSKKMSEPMDFTEFNFISLNDLHNILISIIFPEEMPQFRRFQLTKSDYAFLKETLATLPRESDILEYHTYPNDFRKFLLLDHSKRLNKDYRIFNKVGLSYGFISDVAYIVDEENKIEFFLSATLYANHNEVMNDNHYDYDTIGKPFMRHLAQLIYQYEKQKR